MHSPACGLPVSNQRLEFNLHCTCLADMDPAAIAVYAIIFISSAAALFLLNKVRSWGGYSCVLCLSISTRSLRGELDVLSQFRLDESFMHFLVWARIGQARTHCTSCTDQSNLRQHTRSAGNLMRVQLFLICFGLDESDCVNVVESGRTHRAMWHRSAVQV